MSGTSAQRVARWLAIDPEVLFAPVRDAFPKRPARILDVGAGAGRDAVWMLRQGHDVTCAEPDPDLRAHGQKLAGAAHWVEAALPDLAGLRGPFDLILLSAVWHLVPEATRGASLQRLADLLAPGGTVILSAKNAPDMHCGLDATLVRDAGLAVVSSQTAPSQQAGNAALGVEWEWSVLHAAPTPTAE